MLALRVEVLGGFAVRVNGGDIRPLYLRKARALLAHLALPAGRVHPREKLTALLWGDTPEMLARQAFRQTLSRLRRSLGAAAEAAFVDGPDTVALDPRCVWVDAVEFEAAAATDQPGALQRAAALYRGDLLEGLDVGEPSFEEWRTVERERLRELALETLTKLLRHQMGGDATESAVQTALRILALDPLQETVHRALMRLYAGQGRRAAALHQYQECVQVLQRELGAEPEERTRELYRELVRGVGDSPAGLRSSALGSGGLSPAGAIRVPLIGRSTELGRAERELERALDGCARVAVLSGEAGVGKTRLLEELGERAAARGVRVVVGRCYESEQSLPFRPWVDALRGEHSTLDHTRIAGLSVSARTQLARLFAELSTSATETGIFSDGQGALFEAVRELLAALAADGPMLVALEDAHWADAMSVRLLAFLGRRLGMLPVLVVATVRPEDSSETSGLERALAELRDPAMLESITLGPLGPDHSLALARAVHGGGDPRVLEQAADALWRLSEGNPFVIVETVRMLREAPDDDRAADKLPLSVRETVRRRLARLSEPAGAVALTAAVIGRATSFSLLRAAAGLSEPQAASAVEELVRRRVLDVKGERFDFAHDRIRRVAYEALLPHRRALIHEAVAIALESTTGRDGEDVDEIVGHFLRAGRGDRAYPHLLRFATLAQARYDPDAATTALRRALVAAEQLPSNERDRARLEIGLREGELLAVTGHQQECRDLLERLDPIRARIDDSVLSARFYGTLAIAHFFLGQYADAERVGRKSLCESERTGEPERVGAATFTVGLASIGRGDLRGAATHAAGAVDLFDRPQSRRWQAQAYWLLAQSQVMLGEFTESLANAALAGDIAEAAGDVPFRSIATSVIAWAHAVRGNGSEAVESARKSLALARVPVTRGIAMRVLGYAHVEAGDSAAAIDVLEKLLALSPARHPYVHALACLAEAYRMRGDAAVAVATARQAIELADKAGSPFNLGLAKRALARATPDALERRAALDRAFEAFVTSGAMFETALTRLDLARLRFEEGDAAIARAHVAEALRTFQSAEAPARIAQAHALAREFENTAASSVKR